MTLFQDRVYDQSRSYAQVIGDAFASLFPVSTGQPVAESIVELTGLEPRSRVLEMGVGNGRVLVPLAVMGHRTCGVDSSEVMVERTMNTADQAGVRVRTICHDFRQLDLRETFDLVLCIGGTIGMLTHEDQSLTFATLARHVAPGGWVIIEAHDPDFVRREHRHGSARYAYDHSVGQIRAESRLVGSLGEWWMHYSWSSADGDTTHTAEEFSFLTDPSVQDQDLQAAGLRLEKRLDSWSGARALTSAPRVVSLYRHEGASHE